MSEVVETATGGLRGLERSDSWAYLGIPYAMPPVAERRFRVPIPATPWAGVRDARSLSRPAVQTPLNPSQPPADPGSEDCLYLNVYAPRHSGPHPVLLWVHGGAFVSGSGNEIDGGALAAAGMVVISVNYRIGPFGYMYLGELAPSAADSNLALRDLALALDWTRANVSAFGGDPDQIVLAGESSGAMTVGAMLAMPANTGKFAGALLMSGAGRQVRSPELATRSALKFLEALGLERGDARRITELPTEALVKASAALAAYSQIDEEFDAEVVLPVFGDDVLPLHPMAAVQNGVARDAGLVVTWTLKDMGLFRIFDPENGGRNKELFARRLLGDDTWNRLRAVYAPGEDGYVDLLTDFHFSIPARRLAEAQAKAGGSAYVGRFDRQPSTPPWGRFGPVHTCDLFYLFTPLREPSGAHNGIGPGDGMLQSDRAISTWLREATISLAVSGAPDEHSWPPYESETRATMLIDEPPRSVSDPDHAHRSAWDGLLT